MVGGLCGGAAEYRSGNAGASEGFPNFWNVGSSVIAAPGDGRTPQDAGHVALVGLEPEWAKFQPDLSLRTFSQMRNQG